MCYRIVTRGVLPALLMRFSGPAGLICGVLSYKARDLDRSMWERACSRRRRASQHLIELIHRIREQARSHRG